MPTHLRNSLHDFLSLVSPSFSTTTQDTAQDTAQAQQREGQDSFQAMHWSWYNRYGTQVGVLFI